MPENTETKTVRLPIELWEALDAKAEELGMSRNALLRRMAEVMTQPKETT